MSYSAEDPSKSQNPQLLHSRGQSRVGKGRQAGTAVGQPGGAGPLQVAQAAQQTSLHHESTRALHRLTRRHRLSHHLVLDDDLH